MCLLYRCKKGSTSTALSLFFFLARLCFFFFLLTFLFSLRAVVVWKEVISSAEVLDRVLCSAMPCRKVISKEVVDWLLFWMEEDFAARDTVLGTLVVDEGG